MKQFSWSKCCGNCGPALRKSRRWHVKWWKTNGGKQKQQRGANHSLLKLPAIARPLREAKLCQLSTGMCGRCLGTKGKVTSQCCLECQCWLFLAGFGLQSSRKTRRVPQAVPISTEATTSFMVRSLKCTPPWFGWLFISSFWKSWPWTALLFCVSLGMSLAGRAWSFTSELSSWAGSLNCK